MRLLILIILVVCVGCTQTNNTSKDKKTTSLSRSISGQTDDSSFEWTIYDSDYSMAYSVEYVLTNKYLRITFMGELEGERDSVLYFSKLEENETIKTLSKINIDTLKEDYSNPYVMDGLQMTVKLKKSGKTKTIQISNFYQEDIGRVIELVNSLAPEKYKIWYDKKELQRS